MSLVLFLSLYRSTLCKKMVGRGSRLNQTELFSRSKAMGILIVLFLFLSGCKQYYKTDAAVMKLYQDNEEHFVKAATLLTTYLDDSSIHIFKDDTGTYSRCYIRSFDYFHFATASDSTLSEKEYLSLDEALSPLFLLGRLQSIYWIEDYIFFAFDKTVGKDVNLVYSVDGSGLTEAYMITRSKRIDNSWYIVYTED